MDIFNIFSLFGGLAFFMYGMRLMSSALENLAGGRLESVLRKMTHKPLRGLALGAVITAAIQSSSAVTVMLVGLVNSGIMQFSHSVPVIFGSNVGTTITAWILSLSGIEGDSIFVRLLKPENFAPLAAVAGMILLTASKRKGRREGGGALVGFSLLMIGMSMMSDAVEPLAELEGFREALLWFTNPLLGVLVGAVFTGIIQSSSASVGILQALSLTGRVSYRAAVPLILGQNIGTCVTALLSSIGVGKNARKVAVMHVLFNLIGAAIGLVGLYTLDLSVDLVFFDRAASPAGIAIAHTVFNLSTTVILFPMRALLGRLADRIVGGDDKSMSEREPAFIDERLLLTPSVAVSECDRMGDGMAMLAKNTALAAISLCERFGADGDGDGDRIRSGEGTLDKYEDRIATFLVRISGKKLSTRDSRTVSRLFHSIGDFERIGDHSQNLLESVNEMKSKSLRFSQYAEREITTVTSAIREILEITFSAYTENDTAAASRVEPLEQVIDLLIKKVRENHIKRLRDGACTITHGFVLADMLSNFERISDHCSNIAVTLIETDADRYRSHEYLGRIKGELDPEFVRMYEEFSEKYRL